MPGDMSAAVRSVRKVSAEEAGEIRAARTPGISTLEGRHVEIDVLEANSGMRRCTAGMRYTHRKGVGPGSGASERHLILSGGDSKRSGRARLC